MKRMIVGHTNNNIIAYHRSNEEIHKLDFNKSSDHLGFHCGTLAAANTFKGKHLYELILDKKITLCPYVNDVSSWVNTDGLTAFWRSGAITKEEYLEMRPQCKDDDYHVKLRTLLVSKGVHAFQYHNDSEGVEYDELGDAHYSISYMLLDDAYVIDITKIE